MPPGLRVACTLCIERDPEPPVRLRLGDPIAQFYCQFQAAHAQRVAAPDVAALIRDGKPAAQRKLFEDRIGGPFGSLCGFVE